MFNLVDISINLVTTITSSTSHAHHPHLACGSNRDGCCQWCSLPLLMLFLLLMCDWCCDFCC
eukprot:m.503195 g.503195  ORF g.503195 m.503195 type:complete len:62 (-) comp70256_c0_seq1:140-325(-)